MLLAVNDTNELSADRKGLLLYPEQGHPEGDVGDPIKCI